MKTNFLLISFLCAFLPFAYSSNTYLNATSDTATGSEHSAETPNSFGLGIAYVQNIYKGVDNDLQAVPLINVHYKKFWWRMFTFGYDLYQENDLVASLAVVPYFDGYDSSDSIDLKGMESKEFSVNVGGQIAYRVKPLSLSLFAGHDATGSTNGAQILAKAQMPLPLDGMQWIVIPALSASWISSNVVDYYYGVNKSEARADRPKYSPDATVNYSFSVSSLYQITADWRWTVSVNYTMFGDEVADSPLVSKGNAGALVTGISYLFR